MTTYYAIADANGPISVRIEAADADAAFAADALEAAVDDARADAEDDLGICCDPAAGGTLQRLVDAMEARGAKFVAQRNGWDLYLAPAAIEVGAPDVDAAFAGIESSDDWDDPTAARARDLTRRLGMVWEFTTWGAAHTLALRRIGAL